MQKDINESKFNMWRALVALVMADGEKNDGEVKFLNETFEKLPFNSEQKQTLLGDLKTPQDVNPFFSKIESPADRSQFIYFARLLFWSDGDFSKQEKQIFAHFKDEVMSKADLKKAMQKVEDLTKQTQQNSARGFREALANFAENIFS